MNPAAANQTLLNSDYPVDQIAYLHTASYVISPGFDAYIFNHDLPFTPLMKAVWSTDASWNTTYNIGDGTPSPNPVSSPFGIQAIDIYSNSSSINMVFINSTGSTQTVYIRMWGFVPSGINPEISFTTNIADRFTLNTDYNNPKLFLSGVTPSSSTPGSIASIQHNLGYYPQSEIWHEKNNNTYLTSYSTIFAGLPDSEGALLYTDRIDMYRAQSLGGTSERFHYRIYLDEL